jgi:hypothetical protein
MKPLLLPGLLLLILLDHSGCHKLSCLLLLGCASFVLVSTPKSDLLCDNEKVELLAQEAGEEDIEL